MTEKKLFPERKGMWVDGTGDVTGFHGMHHAPKGITPAPRPLPEPAETVVATLIECIPGLADACVTMRDMPTVYVPRELLVDALRALRDQEDLRFEMCNSVSGVHYPADADADLHAVYHLLSVTHNRRIRLEVCVPTEDPHVPTATGIYPGVNYHERETWDMFGIIFDGHPSLTRILMPDDWEGHPQRKDYGLGGVAVEFSDTDVPPVEQRRNYR
ncbi:NADH-quinone oxidoreductase subunit C [Corynebacterium uterequi]|uniref:NADH-quinone oxidoreductase subunit C n=1 Tax=Corynebacterium uterequi TaxID=1072256 RepID=A0A0G3HHL4_9CORY|nr:NADH-quinone oxidoreductase subunit C [Corynebacterium uterequi]AKK10622.1 NADH/F420H2 dehydrogenase, subunit C [Corynebacterium uterequi]